MIVGYARVSTTDQDLGVQLDELSAHGCERVFRDKATGTNTSRPGLTEMLSFVREGDMVVVTRLDRFARSLPDLFAMLDKLSNKGVAFHCIRQAIDTSTSTGKLTLAILGAVAEFENDLRRERQRDGIERAKQRGAYTGRKCSISRQAVAKLAGEGMKASAIARELGVTRTSVYRILAEPTLPGA